jgi:hypothetical protein
VEVVGVILMPPTLQKHIGVVQAGVARPTPTRVPQARLFTAALVGPGQPMAPRGTLALHRAAEVERKAQTPGLLVLVRLADLKFGCGDQYEEICNRWPRQQGP